MSNFYAEPVWIDNDLIINGHVIGCIRREKFEGSVHWIGYLDNEPCVLGRPLVGGGSDDQEVKDMVLLDWHYHGGYCPPDKA